jgi:hypothetical protein
MATVGAAVALVGIVVAVARFTTHTPGYVLHNPATLYDPLGAHCQSGGGSGALVGGPVLVDDRPAPISIAILIYRTQDLATVFETTGDPRRFKACGLGAGIYTLTLEYPPNDKFILGNIEVKPSLAARVIFTVQDK